MIPCAKMRRLNLKENDDFSLTENLISNFPYLGDNDIKSLAKSRWNAFKKKKNCTSD